MKRILISGYHGFGNCGDEAILWSMVKNFKNINPDIEIIALSKKPSETENLYGIKAINRINIFDIIYNILKCNILVSGGGSLLQDVTSTRSIIYYLGIILLAKMLGKPVVIYANGIGPIVKKSNRFLTRIILNFVDNITLRDSDSKDILLEIGVNKPKILVTADPVFSLDPIKLDNYSDVSKRIGFEADKPLVVFSIRKWPTQNDYEEIIAKIADIVADKYNCNILFIPMHFSEDIKEINNVQALMSNKSYNLDNTFTTQEYIGIIGEAKVVISMRLHTLIFAAVQNTPMIGIVYDPKVKSFLEIVNQPSAGDINDIDGQEIINLLDKIFDNGSLVNLNNHVNELRIKALNNDEIVLNILSDI